MNFGNTVNRPRILKTIQWLVAILAFTFIIRRIDWGNAAEIVQDVDFRWFLVAFLLSMVGLMSASYRWAALLSATRVHIPVKLAFLLYAIGSFFGLAMPGSIGGDGVRVLLCKRYTEQSVALVTATVISERALGVVALFCIFCFGIYRLPALQQSTYTAFILIIGAIGILFVLLLPVFIRILSQHVLSINISSKSRAIRFLCQTILNLEPVQAINIRALFGAFMGSLVFQMMDICVTLVLSQSLKMDLNAEILFFTMPIVYLATVIPVSPGGLGVRESVLVLVLSQFGIPPSHAALLSIAIFLNRVLLAAFGGTLYLIANPLKGGRAKIAPVK